MFRALGIAWCVFTAAPCFAQSFTYDGTMSLSATDMMGGQGIGFIDATFGFPLTQRAPLAFEFGTYLFALDGKRPHETYGALVWDGKYRVGAVRPAYDVVLPSVFEETAPYLAYTRAEYARSHNTTEAMRRTAVPWGASVSGSFDKVNWVVSAHDAVKGTFRSSSVAMTYTAQGWRVMAAIEGVWSRDNSHDGINAKLGAEVDIGTTTATLAWLHPDANSRPDALAFDLKIPATARVEVDLFGEFTDDGSDDAYGLAIGYSFRNDSTLVLSATDGAHGPTSHLTYAISF